MRRSGLLATLSFGAVVATAVALSPPAGDVELVWSSLDAGGGSVSGDGLRLQGTIGQADASTMSGADFTLRGGFLALTPVPCPGDTNGDASVDVDDLINVILDWATPGHDHGGDVDGSEMVDVDDLVLVILEWGVCP